MENLAAFLAKEFYVMKHRHKERWPELFCPSATCLRRTNGNYCQEHRKPVKLWPDMYYMLLFRGEPGLRYKDSRYTFTAGSRLSKYLKPAAIKYGTPE